MSRRRESAQTPAESTHGSLTYVYAIGGSGMPVRGAPGGIDGEAVTAVERAGLTALVSALDAASYGRDRIEAGVGEVEWIAPRAAAHDSVVTWASQPGPVVPLRMWTLFADTHAVATMLEQQAPGIGPLLERLRDADEYGLRVFADVNALAVAVKERDDTLAELRRSATAAGPGQKYLIERKIEAARGEAVAAMARVLARKIHDRLAEQSRDAATDEVPAGAPGEARVILSAAFLVSREGLDAFRAALTELVREHEPQGLRFSFTGPWPAYHFAAGLSGGAGRETVA